MLPSWDSSRYAPAISHESSPGQVVSPPNARPSATTVKSATPQTEGALVAQA